MSSDDPVLGAIAPIGLASAAGAALIIDLIAPNRTRRTLTDIILDGPRLDELSPGRRGVAVLGAGAATPAELRDPVERLAASWPAIVIRAEQWPGPTVPVRGLFPGVLAPSIPETAVWQRLGWGSRAPGPGPVLPAIPAWAVRRMLDGGLPVSRRWVEAWVQVWRMPWA